MDTKMKFRLCQQVLLLLILLGLIGCTQTTPRETDETSITPKVGANGMQIDSNASFMELAAKFPELELPFPRLEEKMEGKVRVARFPSDADCYHYQRRHPEMRIPPQLVEKYLDRNPQMIPSTRKEGRYIASAVGKISRDSFVVLIYHLAISTMQGGGLTLEESDSLIKAGFDDFMTEFRLETYTPKGKRIASNPFGFDRSEDSEDNGCAELLPDLTANVYDNPDCFIPYTDANCRVDHHVLILPDGKMKVKTKKYE